MMALEALSSNELLNFIIYDTISATPFSSNDSNNSCYENSTNFLLDNGGLKTDNCGGAEAGGGLESCSCMPPPPPPVLPQRQQNSLAVQGRKKRRRRQRVCKNKEEAETQRMTHIAVERNRRKQMNEHLAVLRSLMPESYVQRGDQASIVGGAIEFVKELEHHLQSLEAQKFLLLQQHGGANDKTTTTTTTTMVAATATATATWNKCFPPAPTPFAQFFSYPQYTCSAQLPNKYTSKSKAAIADIEVTLIETHANVRILSRRRVRQLSKMVVGLQTLYLTILHLNITTLDPLVLYSISAKVEEGCLLNSADDIAGAVHHILRIIEEEATLCCQA